MNVLKLRNLLKLLIITFVVGGVAPLDASAASKTKNTPAQTEKAAKKPRTVVREFPYAVDQVRVAALEALAKIGCKIKKDSKGYIEGQQGGSKKGRAAKRVNPYCLIYMVEREFRELRELQRDRQRETCLGGYELAGISVSQQTKSTDWKVAIAA